MFIRISSITLLRSILFLFLLLHFDMVKAQNSQVSSADSIVILQQEQVVDIRNDVSILVFDVDTLKRDVSYLYDEVILLTNDVDVYTNRWNWDAIGSLFSVVSIIVMIIVYILTRRQTNKQIENQKEDTERKLRIQKLLTKKQIDALFKNTNKQIEEQHKLNDKQIDKMQDNSDKRTENLERLGKQIQSSTGEIRDAVVHFESRFITERDKARIVPLYSSVITNYEALYMALKTDYDHFITNTANDKIHQTASKIKDSIRGISQILSSYSNKVNLPESQLYINSINEVVDKPNLQDKRNQTDMFKNEGQKYNEQLGVCIQTLFYKK